MKKIILTAAAIILSMQTNAMTAPVEQITEQRGYISANAEKTKEVYPDTAKISFTKETTAKTMEAASTENKTAMNKINAALSTYKTDSSKVEIQTGNYSAYPNYNYSEKSNKKTITGYTVVNTITVKTKSPEILGKMIDSAIKAGADRVNSLSFSFENDGTICRGLISEATKEAEKTASIAAVSAHQSLKGIKAISTGCYTEMNNRTDFRMYNAKAATLTEDASAGETPTEPGKIKVRATVNAEFYVK